MERERRAKARAVSFLWLLVLTGTVVRLFLAHRYFGFRGDEVEVLEAAFGRLGILDYTPWDLRNLLLPDLVVSPTLWAAQALGVTDVGQRLWIATWPFVVCGSLNVVLIFALALRWTRQIAVAQLAAVLYSCHWIHLAYGATAYPRTAAVTCILAAALLLARPGRDVPRGLLAGAILAVAFAFRYSEIIFLGPLLGAAWLGTEDRHRLVRRSSALLLGFAAGALLTVGVYDLVTWGKPFSSLIAFVDYTLIEKQASTRVVAQPALWYLRRLLHWLTPTLLPFLALAWRQPGSRRSALFLVLPIAALSAIHHKELRYLQGAVPFLNLLAAIGAVALWRRGARWAVAVLVALSCLLSIAGARVLHREPMAAVEAARYLAGQGARVVALSQHWAYGDRLYLGNEAQLRRLATPPTAAELEAQLPGAEWAGLYRDDLAEHPELREVLHRHGFFEERDFTWGRSRTVVLFRYRGSP